MGGNVHEIRSIATLCVEKGTPHNFWITSEGFRIVFTKSREFSPAKVSGYTSRNVESSVLCVCDRANQEWMVGTGQMGLREEEADLGKL